MVSGSAAGAIKLWSLTEGVQLDIQEATNPAGVSALAFLEPAVVCHLALTVHGLRLNVTAKGLRLCNYSNIVHNVMSK